MNSQKKIHDNIFYNKGWIKSKPSKQNLYSYFRRVTNNYNKYIEAGIINEHKGQLDDSVSYKAYRLRNTNLLNVFPEWKEYYETCNG